MATNQKNDGKLVEKYKPHLMRKRGIFTSKTRGNLLGLSMKGRKANNDFRYDVKTSVKTALKDLELFIEVADKNDVDEILSKETLEPIIFALLWSKLDADRVEIARLFMREGLNYLLSKGKKEEVLLSFRPVGS